jgi:hypothetical protein
VPAVVCETDLVPLVACPPLHAFDAVQLVALVEDQLSVADWPVVKDVGLTEIVTVGAGVATGAVTVKTAEPTAVTLLEATKHVML